MRLAAGVLFLGLLCAIPIPANAQKGGKQKEHSISIGGIVLTDEIPEHASSRLPYNPIEGVTVTVTGDKITDKDREKDSKETDPDKKKYTCITDERGFFHFNDLPKGDYTVTFTKKGFTTQTKTSTVNGDAIGDNLRITMNPPNFSMIDGTPNGPGTVYIAFTERREGVIKNDGDGPDKLLRSKNTMLQAIAAGVDPLTIGGNVPIKPTGKDLEQNGLSPDANTLMIYPPGAPGRTGYSKLDVHPYWVCFNKTGSTLFISTDAQMIQVLDAAHGNRLIANLPTRGPVVDISPSLDKRYILASIIGNHAVMLIDTNTNTPVNLLPCAGAPRAAAMMGDRVFVVEGDNASGHLQVINAATGATIGMVPTGPNPTGLAITPDGRRILVANSGAASVSVLDGTSLAEVTRIGVGVNPIKVAVSPDGLHAYVTNKGSDSVSVIDTRTMGVTATIPVGNGPIGVAVSLDSKKVYIGCKDAGSVDVLDGSNGNLVHTTNPQPHSSPWGIAIRP